MNDAPSDWLARVAQANRRQIYRPRVGQLARQRMRGQMWNWRAWYAAIAGNGHADYARNWTTALNLLGAQWMHRVRGQSADMEALVWAFDQCIDRSGKWKRPPNSVRHAMQGYSLLYLVECTGERRYSAAADALAEMLKQHPRSPDGSLFYSSDTSEVLVDTLAMVCPFLARDARMTGDQAGRQLALRQLERFIEWNLDVETALPFHGYVSGGDRRLGLLAWGRGVGWYLLGIVDTLAELNSDDPAFAALREALQSALVTLMKHQHPDGQWGWAILQPGAAGQLHDRAGGVRRSSRRIAGNRKRRELHRPCAGSPCQSDFARRPNRRRVGRMPRPGHLSAKLRTATLAAGHCHRAGGAGRSHAKQSRAPCLFKFLMSQQLLSQETSTERADQPASRAATSTLAPKVVLTGVTGLRNRGVEALVVTTIAGLRAQWPAAQITVLSRSPEYDSFRLTGCTDVKVIANTLHDLQPWPQQMTRTLRSLLRHGRLPRDAAQQAIREASLVIALGGDVFSSDYASAGPSASIAVCAAP